MIRLLVYMIFICSASIAGTLMFYSYNLSDNERKETSEQVSRLHEQTLQRLRQTFQQIDYMTRDVGNDYVIQRLTDDTAAKDTAEEKAQRDYVDMLIKQQMSQFPYITDVCITANDNRFMLCTNSEAASPLLDTRRLSLQKQDRFIVSRENDGSSASASGVIFISPLIDRKTNVIRGSIQFMVSLNSIMNDIYGRWPLLRHRLTDSEGNVMYIRVPAVKSGQPNEPDWGSSKSAKLQWKDDTVLSQLQVDMPGSLWVSRIEAPQMLDKAHDKALQLTLLLVAAILLFMGVLSSKLFKLYLTRPMNQLRLLMKRAELGDFKAYWVSKSGKEWSDLGESYNQMLNRLEELIKQVKKEESLKKEAEMEALQYQLNPHFLYNTLNTIKWVAKMHQTPQIAEVVTSLVRLLQASLGKKGDFITIREEIGLIHDYMEIQSFRYGDRVQLECSVDPLANQCLVPRMILQPLIENAIIHGIEPGRQSGRIGIRIWLDVQRDLLYCQVEDDGVGMARDMLPDESSHESMRERMSGIGLRHIREKIKLYYGEGYSMQIMTKARQGTTIRLTLPVHQSEVE